MNEKKGKDLVKGFEDLRLKAYYDTKRVPTIGWGHTKEVKITDIITLEQAETFFESDYNEHKKLVESIVKTTLSSNQMMAVISLVYNIGGTAFKNSTLLQYINNKNFIKAGDEFLVWDKVTIKGLKQVSEGLRNRRVIERTLFLTKD